MISQCQRHGGRVLAQQKPPVLRGRRRLQNRRVCQIFMDIPQRFSIKPHRRTDPKRAAQDFEKHNVKRVSPANVRALVLHNLLKINAFKQIGIDKNQFEKR